MTLTRVEGPPGSPWERRLAGRLDRLTVRSEILDGNPLGDPSNRPLYVYVPPGVDGSAPVPSIYLLHPYGGQVDMWANRAAFEPTLIERVDGLFSDSAIPRTIVVFPDATTRYGGSQWINSSGTGRYMDYLCGEVVAFVDETYPTIPEREGRGITGHSSGGYGALVAAMLHPEIFAAIGSHAADSLFEACYGRSFPAVARKLRDEFEGSYEVFLERFEARDRFDYDRFGPPLEAWAMSLCYSPDPEHDGRPLIPFDLETGGYIEETWERWLAWDPVRMAPGRLDALRAMRFIYLEAGKGDEYFLDLGTHAFVRVLERAGIDHRFELFEGAHGGIKHRYTTPVRLMAEVLSHR